MQDSPQVQAIRARYKASFPEKAEMISDCLNVLTELGERSDVDAVAQLTTIKEELHKLAGSSGMYGYDDICDCARGGMAAIDDDDRDSVNQHLQSICDLLGKHA